MTTSSSRRVPRTIEFFPVAFLETTSQDITYYGRSSARRMWSWSADVRWVLLGKRSRSRLVWFAVRQHYRPERERRRRMERSGGAVQNGLYMILERRVRRASNPVTALTRPHVLAVLGLEQWAFHWDMLHVQVRCWFSTQPKKSCCRKIQSRWTGI